MTAAPDDRLFVPLATDPYRWFESGVKQWEVRRMTGSFSLEHVRLGRLVELRRGYSTPDSIWGHVAGIVVAESLADLYRKVPYLQVTPLAASLDEALAVASKILGIDPDQATALIAFRVECDRSST
jgi:hypothetical protein